MPTITVRFATNVDELKRNLKEGLNQIEATKAGADRMAKSLGGENLMRAAHNFAAAVQQIGGVEKLTNAERERGNAILTKTIEKYQALGQTAPQALRQLADATANAGQKTAIFGDAFKSLVAGFTAANLIDRGVRGLIDFGKEAINSAGAIIDLSNKLGVSTDAIQKWTAAGISSGTSTEDFADAAFKLGINIAGGSGSVKSALDQLGLSYKSFRALQPEQQFDVLVQKLEGVTDVQERNRIGNELFGKSWKNIAAAVADGYTQMSQSADKSTKAQLEALDKLGDKWDEFVNRQQTRLRSWLGQNVVVFDQISKLTEEQRKELERIANSSLFGGPAQARKFLQGLAQQEEERKKPPPVVAPPSPVPLGESLAKARAELAALTAEQRRNIDAGLALKKNFDQISNSVNISEDAFNLYKDQLQAVAEAQRKAKSEAEKKSEADKRLTQSIRELEIITAGYRISVGELDTTELKSIETWLAKKKAADDLAASVRKMLNEIEQVKPGHVDVNLLPGLDVETIPRLGGHLDDLEKKTKQWHEALDNVSRSWAQIAQIAPGVLGTIAGGIGTAINSLNLLIQAQQAFTAAAVGSFARALAALNVFLAGFQIGLALAMALRNVFSGPGAIGGAARRAAAGAAGHAATGGFVTATGIQRFAVGGIVQPQGPDSVPILAAPGEVILNKAQQADILGSQGVTVNVDLRGAIGVDRNAIRKLGVLIAPSVARAIAENKRGPETSGAFTSFRGALGMRS